jgi:maltose/moltooligosaccharide transporter
MAAQLDYKKTFLLGFGFFGLSVVWGIYNAFVPIFLSEKFHLSPLLIGFFMTLDNIAALFIQPPVGAWSDRVRSPMGRRIPFLLVGAPITAVAFGLIPLPAVLPLFVACTSTMLLSAAIWRTPVIALMPDITPSEFRSQANGIINFMGGIGAIIALQTGGILYKLSPNFPFWLGSGLVLASALVVYLFIEEPGIYTQTPQPAQPGIFGSLREIAAQADKSGIRILLAIFFWFIGFSAVDTFFTLYAKNHLGLPEGDGATLLSVLPLFFVLFAIPAGFIAGRIGRRNTICIGLLIISLMLVLLYVTPAQALLTGIAPLPLLGIPLVEGGARMLSVAGVLLIFCGAGWALININSLPMIVDLTDAARIGTFTGLYYLFSTLSAIIGPNVNGFAIQSTGNNYNIIMLIAPIFMLVALWLMLGVKQGEASS